MERKNRKYYSLQQCDGVEVEFPLQESQIQNYCLITCFNEFKMFSVSKRTDSFASENQSRCSLNRLSVVYFDQLLGVACTQKLVELLFQPFSTFLFSDFRREITEFFFKLTKKVENSSKKVVQPAFGCAQHRNAGQNTQQLAILRF